MGVLLVCVVRVLDVVLSVWFVMRVVVSVGILVVLSFVMQVLYLGVVCASGCYFYCSVLHYL